MFAMRRPTVLGSDGGELPREGMGHGERSTKSCSTSVLAALESARTWSPRVVSKLESHIRSADDAGLFRINPMTFAAEKGIAEDEAIDLFLHASALGLFEMNWILLCPICSCVIESFRALKNLDSHCRCTKCHLDLVAALDDMIAVTFTVSPAIRRIAYHDPGDALGRGLRLPLPVDRSKA